LNKKKLLKKLLTISRKPKKENFFGMPSLDLVKPLQVMT